jgi:chemotaxis protein methyltransferase CheR
MTLPSLRSDEFETLRDLIRTRTGLVFPPSRQKDLEAGIQQTMTSNRLREFDRLVALLEREEATFDTLIANITVAETYFFREPAQFEAIRRLMLPALRRRVPNDDQIRIWSAGCASGEEAYSLAILMETEGLAGKARILATDISRAALARARAAEYGAWSLRDGSANTQYFSRQNSSQGDRFLLEHRFRERVEFKYLNLASTAYPSPITGTVDMDLIVCRNVLIYFDADAIRRVAVQMFDCLKPGGWLITGPSDPPLWEHAPYRTLVTSGGILYRRDPSVDGQIEITRSVPRPEAVVVPTPLPQRELDPPSSNPPQVQIPVAAAMVGESGVYDFANEIRKRIVEIRALADRGLAARAERKAAEALQAFPLEPELHYLHAIALAELQRHDDAVTALRRVIYLDPSLAVAHFTLGSILSRNGAIAEARRTYQNALTLCLTRPEGEILALSDDQPTGSLIEASRAQLARLGAETGSAR